MDLWKILLIVLPVGFVGGFLGARLAGPETSFPFASETSSRAIAGNDVDEARQRFIEEDRRRIARQDRYGAEEEEDEIGEEFAPRERDGIYSYYDDLAPRQRDDGFFDGERDRGDGSFYRDGGGDRAAAENAAQAAERAVNEVARVAGNTASQASAAPPAATTAPAPRPHPRRSPAPVETATPREPQSGEGDLPAIW